MVPADVTNGLVVEINGPNSPSPNGIVFGTIVSELLSKVGGSHYAKVSRLNNGKMNIYNLPLSMLSKADKHSATGYLQKIIEYKEKNK